MKTDDDKKRYVRIAGLIAFGVMLFAVLMNLGTVLGGLKTLIGFFLPLIVGIVIAFILDVPVRGVQKLIGRMFPKSENSRWVRVVSLIFTMVILAGIIIIVAKTVYPVIADSMKSAGDIITAAIPAEGRIPGWKGMPIGDIMADLKSMFSENSLKEFPFDVNTFVSAVLDKTVDTVSYMTTMVLGSIISIYILFDKDRVLRHTNKLITAVFPQNAADIIRKVAGMINTTYSGFLSGQCIEAFILSVFMFIVLAVFRIPYAALIAMLAAVLSFVPYLGAFLAFAIGVLLTFITAPGKLVLLIILYLTVQIVEEQLIYPHVVGTSVGLSPLLTLLAVIIGGNTFGLLGVLFFIPLMSVFYELVREWADNRIKNRPYRE